MILKGQYSFAFNFIIIQYEIKPLEIAEYLRLVRSTRKGRKTLVHKLLDHWGHAEAILELSICQDEINKRTNI